MKKIFLLFSLFQFCLWTSADQTIEVNHLRSWQIITAPKASPAEQYAAEEFKYFFQQASGIVLEISTGKDTHLSTRQIYIGAPSALTTDVTDISLEQLGEEGFSLQISPEQIYIIGGQPRGTLYGVYEFLERYLGIRFLTFDHTYIPPKTNLAIPCEIYNYKPPFSFRWSYYGENVEHSEFTARLRGNTIPKDKKFGGLTHQNLISHSFMDLLPVEKYGKEHPEYFALVDGERKMKAAGGGPQPCVTDPKVIEIVSENVIHAIDTDPALQNYSVSQNDNGEYCHCERCEAINKREGTPMGAHLAFVNAVAERVWKKYPNVKIGTLAYQYTRKAPKTIKPLKNVQIQLCSIECCTVHPLNDPSCEKNREFCKDLDEWSKICGDIWVWHYNINFNAYDFPCPNWFIIGSNVRYFVEHNVKGVFMQSCGGVSAEFSDLRNYVISRCLWNPSLDGQKELEDFCRYHYQEAGDVVVAYLKGLYQHVLAGKRHPGCFASPYESDMTPMYAQELYQQFQDIIAKAKNEDTARRLEKASISTYRAVIETCGNFVIKDNALMLTWPSPLDQVIDKYPQLVERHKVSSAADEMSMPDFVKLIQRLNTQGIPIIRLENEFWKLAVVPENNGKIVQLVHKQTGRNFLYNASQGMFYRLFGHLNCQEMAMKGYNSRELAAFSPQLDGNKLTMTKTLKDGSLLVRIIQLGNTHPDDIVFTTNLKHLGTEEREYQFKVCSEFNIETLTADSHVLTGYFYDKKWIPFTDGWREWDGPMYPQFANASDGIFGFYNYALKFGLRIKYDPATMGKPGYDWYTDRPYLQWEFHTTPVTLKQGESLSYTYTFNYWDKPPVQE